MEVLLFVGIYGSKVVIIEEDTDVEVGVGVREKSTRGEGVDRWAVREFSEPWSDLFPRQSQGSLRDEINRYIPQCTCSILIFTIGHDEPNVSGDEIGLLPITPWGVMVNEKGRVYCAHGSLRPFMTELVVSLSSSQHGSHTLRK